MRGYLFLQRGSVARRKVSLQTKGRSIGRFHGPTIRRLFAIRLPKLGKPSPFLVLEEGMSVSRSCPTLARQLLSVT